MPRTGSTGVSRQTGNTAIGRPLQLGNQPKPNALGSNQTASGRRGPICITAPCPTGFGVRQTGNGVNPRPFNVGNLPKPNSLGGTTRPAGSDGNTRPFNLANLPRPNALGSVPRPVGTGGNTHPLNLANLPRPTAIGGLQRPVDTGGNTHPLNLANLPRPNALGSVPRPVGTGGNTRPFNIANLPKPNALSATSPSNSAHQGGGNTGPLAHEGTSHALIEPKTLAAQNQKGNGVVGAAKKVGEGQQKLDDADAKLKAGEKAVADDKKGVAADQAILKATTKERQDALLKLDADTRAGAPKAIIAADLAKAKVSQSAVEKAGLATEATQNKLASDQKAVAADKQNVAAEKKDLKQAQQTLSDKQKIAQQANEIGKLKDNQQDANNNSSNDQSSDSGQASNNQPADNGQSSSGGNASNSTSDTGSGSGTVSTRPVDNSVVNNNRTIAAVGTSVAAGAALTARAVPVLPAPPPDQVAALPSPPGTAAPDQAAAPGPTTFVLVGFQKDVSEEDLAAFLQAYSASIVEGPNNDGLVKLQITGEVPADQVQAVLDSMKSQTNIVLSAVVDDGGKPTQ